jgi:NADH-quinone oxidoreductase subunit J
MTMQVSALQIAFAVFTILTLGGALGVVISRNLIHAALFLVVTLFGVAGYFVLLDAPFLAAVQVLVYIGAIAVIVIFAVMLTRSIAGTNQMVQTDQWIAAAVTAVALLVTLGLTLLNQFGGLAAPQADVPENSVELLGSLLVDPRAFLLPFEVASVLLLTALIGSVVVARE